VRDGQDLYRDYRNYPFIIALYPPVYYYAVGISARLAQFDTSSMLVLVRTLSALAAAASCACVTALARYCGASCIGALAAGGLLLSSYALQPWSYTARPDKARIFDRFFQEPGGNFRSGLGLGLYVSREIVELHAGQIQVESPPDGGSLLCGYPAHGRSLTTSRAASIREQPAWG